MNTILKCNSCGSIMVVNNKDLWKIRKCTKCDSTNIVNVDDEFEYSELEEKKECVMVMLKVLNGIITA